MIQDEKTINIEIQHLNLLGNEFVRIIFKGLDNKKTFVDLNPLELEELESQIREFKAILNEV